jgi:hypothetical protein
LTQLNETDLRLKYWVAGGGNLKEVSMAETHKASSPTGMYLSMAALMAIVVAALWFYSH